MMLVSTRATPRTLVVATTCRAVTTNYRDYPPSKSNRFFNIAQRSQVHVIERLGKFHRKVTAQPYFTIPVIDRIVAVVDEREMVFPITPQHAITMDNINIELSGVLCIKVTDAVLFTYAIQHPLYALINLAESSMRAECGKMSLDSLLHERSRLNDGVRIAMEHTLDSWGVEVLRYEVTEIRPDERVAEAMDLQAVAEREKRQEVIKAEADKQAVITRAEGAAIAVEKEATARATAMRLQADGQAYAINTIAQALATEGGRQSMQVELAKQYIATLAQLGQHSRLLMIPQDASDVGAMIMKATSIANSISAESLAQASASSSTPASLPL